MIIIPAAEFVLAVRPRALPGIELVVLDKLGPCALAFVRSLIFLLPFPTANCYPGRPSLQLSGILSRLPFDYDTYTNRKGIGERGSEAARETARRHRGRVINVGREKARDFRVS